jgi:hypothetical protein
MNLQNFENERDLMIKFASLTDAGRLIDDAHEEYIGLFDNLPDEWVIEHKGIVQTTKAGPREGWLLRQGNFRIAAVAHETGLELLLIGVATDVAAAAVIGFTAWAWSRWAEKRKYKPQPPETIQGAGWTVQLPDTRATPALVFEQVADRFPDGRIRETHRWEVHGPIQPENLADLISRGLGRP